MSRTVEVLHLVDRHRSLVDASNFGDGVWRLWDNTPAPECFAVLTDHEMQAALVAGIYDYA